MTPPYRAMEAVFERSLQQAWTQDPPERVSEDFAGGLSPRDHLLMQQGYRRLTQSGSNLVPPRDLQPLAQDQMLRIVFWQWQQNAIAQWMIETTVDFVLGEGASVEADDDTLREVVDRFWNDPVNQLDRRLDSFTREFGLYGELVLPAFVNEIDGHVRLGYVDPLEIKEVVSDPENLLLTTAVILKARADDNRERVLKVIRPDTNRDGASYGYLMGAQPGEQDPFLKRPYDGSCFLFQTNKLSNGKRGRSDLLALIDWADGFDQWLFDALDQANLLNSYVWDVEMQGATEQQMGEWLEKNRKLKRGQMFVHNEKLKMEPKVPMLQAMEKDVFARQIRGLIVGTRGFPEHWFGLAGDVNFASAKEMGLPPVKRLSRRQKELRYLIRDLVTFQIHQAIVKQRLKATVTLEAAEGQKAITKPADQAFRVILPELSMRDQSGIVAAATSLAAALSQAVTQGWTRPETAARVFNALLSQLGTPIDPKEEFSPGGAAAGAYNGLTAQQEVERLRAQLERSGNGNGENVNEPKRTTDRGGQPAAV